ncbi:MAG: putative toxin-antitoxin system toxin component, PIN family, partial [Burkholderiales bacterium]|nr:putative toxin-antitoxin system toxin component, PIN family [Burkholderiales bacterium]
ESPADSSGVPLPVCKDPDDQKFLELARDCRADFLITKDRDLLVFARRKFQPLPFRIVTPLQFPVITRPEQLDAEAR